MIFQQTEHCPAMHAFHPVRRLVSVAALSAVLLGLGACGQSRDQLMSEKLARAEAAAKRAEKAQAATEKAAATMGAKIAAHGPMLAQDADTAQAIETIEENAESRSNSDGTDGNSE
jgi:hypothetical protein